jgi:3-oxoacyl-[acyl-carrier-protein] synthase-3
MTVEVFLDHPIYALGERTFSLEESSAAGRTQTSTAALLKSGFARHHICGPQTTAFDLAKAAVEGIADKLGDIDAIVYATALPINANVAPPELYRNSRDIKHLLDYPASRLQSHFRLDRAQVIGLEQQACTGMLGAVRLARALINTEDDCQRVLCVTADRFPDDAIYEQSYNLISDGAAAVVVSRVRAGFRVVATHHITNGAMVTASDDEIVGSYFSYNHRLLTEVLHKAQLRPSDITWVLPQNTNLLAWKVMSGMLGLPMERVWCPTIAEVGHVISGDNIINLADLQRSGRIRPGDRLLMLMAGFGMNWQCTVLEAV